MDTLPLDVFSVLFQFLDSQTLVRCARVCKKLNEQASHDKIWKTLVARDFGIGRIDTAGKSSWKILVQG